MIRALLNRYRQHRACVALERDRQLRAMLVGKPYAKRRQAGKLGWQRRKAGA